MIKRENSSMGIPASMGGDHLDYVFFVFVFVFCFVFSRVKGDSERLSSALQKEKLNYLFP